MAAVALSLSLTGWQLMSLAVKWLELDMIASEIEMLARTRAMDGANIHKLDAELTAVNDRREALLSQIYEGVALEFMAGGREPG